MSNSNIVGIVTAHDGEELLSHFVPHYFRLGIEQLHVVVARDSAMLRRARDLSSRWPITIHTPHGNAMGEEIKTHTERDILLRSTTDRDWMLHLDLDEFHEYPFRLRTIVDSLELAGAAAISTELVDRLAPDGRLVPLLPEPSIFSQFPVGSTITKSWLALPSTKVMICRGWVELDYGRHRAKEVECSIPSLGQSSQYRVHHFKWFAGIKERLRIRTDTWVGMDRWYQEHNRRFAASIVDNRIDPQAVPGFEWCGDYTYPTD